MGEDSLADFVRVTKIATRLNPGGFRLRPPLFIESGKAWLTDSGLICTQKRAVRLFPEPGNQVHLALQLDTIPVSRSHSVQKYGNCHILFSAHGDGGGYFPHRGK